MIQRNRFVSRDGIQLAIVFSGFLILYLYVIYLALSSLGFGLLRLSFYLADRKSVV